MHKDWWSIYNKFNLGSVTVNRQVVGLTGQEFTASQGTAVAPNETVQLFLVYQ